jgi:hypothetical protein
VRVSGAGPGRCPGALKKVEISGGKSRMAP